MTHDHSRLLRILPVRPDGHPTRRISRRRLSRARQRCRADRRQSSRPADARPHVQGISTRAMRQRLEALAGKIRAADAFVFVTGEYNWGMQPGLKNLTDHFLEEWFWRPAAIASYSASRISGAALAFAWHGILSEMGMTVISSTLASARSRTRCRGRQADRRAGQVACAPFPASPTILPGGPKRRRPSGREGFRLIEIRTFHRRAVCRAGPQVDDFQFACRNSESSSYRLTATRNSDRNVLRATEATNPTPSMAADTLSSGSTHDPERCAGGCDDFIARNAWQKHVLLPLSRYVSCRNDHKPRGLQGRRPTGNGTAGVLLGMGGTASTSAAPGAIIRHISFRTFDRSAVR